MTSVAENKKALTRARSQNDQIQEITALLSLGAAYRGAQRRPETISGLKRAIEQNRSLQDERLLRQPGLLSSGS